MAVKGSSYKIVVKIWSSYNSVEVGKSILVMREVVEYDDDDNV